MIPRSPPYAPGSPAIKNTKEVKTADKINTKILDQINKKKTKEVKTADKINTKRLDQINKKKKLKKRRLPPPPRISNARVPRLPAKKFLQNSKKTRKYFDWPPRKKRRNKPASPPNKPASPNNFVKELRKEKQREPPTKSTEQPKERKTPKESETPAEMRRREIDKFV